MPKKVILFFISIIILALVFSVPFYNFWFSNNIFNYNNLMEQAGYMSPEQRKLIRFGNSYAMYIQIAEALRKEGGADPVILLPPDEYVQQHGIKDFHIVEPLEFYYFTGIKAVTIESKDVERATWTLTPAKDPPLILVRMNVPEVLKNYVDTYKKYIHH